jgi:hypothetical protein
LYEGIRAIIHKKKGSPARIAERIRARAFDECIAQSAYRKVVKVQFLSPAPILN